MSERSEYRSGHDQFLPNNALYVIVLDSKNPLGLQRNADFWFRFVKYSVDSADVLFLLLKEPDNGADVIDFERFAKDSHCHVHREIACISSDEDDHLTLDSARGILTHAINRLPSYNYGAIPGWKQAVRHISVLFEVQTSLSYIPLDDKDIPIRSGSEDFEKICARFVTNKYGGPPSAKMRKVFRDMLVEARVCYDDGNGNLYGIAWLSCFVYAMMKHAANKYGEITANDLGLYLMDNVDQYDYFDAEIKKLLEGFSTPTEKRSLMCIKWDKNIYEYLLPQFSHMRERLPVFLSEKSRKEESIIKKWRKTWTDRSRGFRLSEYINHYIIDMPLLTDGMYVNIVCRLAASLCEEMKNTAANIAVGADGLIAWWDKSEKHNTPICLLVDGVTAAPGRIQIFVGPGNENDEIDSTSLDFQPNSPALKELMTRLNEIRDYAFDAFFNAIRDNVPLMVNMRTYLVLPNHYLMAQQGTLGGRLALRGIYYSKKSGKRNYDYIEGSLPMDRLRIFIPESYAYALESVLNM